MKIDHAQILYLSGTGTTEAYARAFAEGLPYPVELQALRIDATLPPEMNDTELLVLAVPVYAGYVPAFVWELLANFHATQTPTVLLAVYGARDYDNALHEMDEKLRAKGCVTWGAAALVARHSIAQTIASNRPDAHDLEQTRAFAATIAERITAAHTPADAPTFDFKTVEVDLDAHVYPITLSSCIQCGICAVECPADAIPQDAPDTTDQDKCISCLHCIEVCPEHARQLPEGLAEQCAAMLAHEGADPAKPNEFF